jgi:hypothetical protein
MFKRGRRKVVQESSCTENSMLVSEAGIDSVGLVRRRIFKEDPDIEAGIPIVVSSSLSGRGRGRTCSCKIASEADSCALLLPHVGMASLGSSEFCGKIVSNDVFVLGYQVYSLLLDDFWARGNRVRLDVVCDVFCSCRCGWQCDKSCGFRRAHLIT